MSKSPRYLPALLCVAAIVLLLAPAAARPPAALATSYGAGASIPFMLFPPTNPWNTRVDTLPLDPSSAGYIAHMDPSAGLHPDFGTVWDGAPNGIPYVVVPGDQPKVPITFSYADESDPGPYPIPPDAPIEGGAASTGDRHVLILDPDNQLLWEVYDAHHQADGSWQAGSGAVFHLDSTTPRPTGWTSADAAGLPILPGLVRYDEAVVEGVIDHALRFTMARTQRKYVYPATHYASSLTDPSLPPMGLRVRLKAGYDISGFPPDVRVVLQALKTYGMMVADNGSDWYVSGAPDERWDDATLHSLSLVKGSDFEVVDSRALVPGAFFVSLPAAVTVPEGSRWVRQGSFFDASGSSWTATVDYAAGGGAGPAALALAAGKTFSLSQTWRDEGRHTVRVAVANDLGGAAAASVVVTVANVAPRVHAGAAVVLAAGARLWRRCSFADPGHDHWSGWVNYGDGTPRKALYLPADKTFVLSHTFPRRHGVSYTVTVRVNDGDGGAGTARFRVTVR